MERVLNYPLYVPDLGRRVTDSLVLGELQAFVMELWRLSRLGSSAASALLGYLYFRGAVDGKPNYARAEELCRAAAQSGDAYAQYVMGWICRQTNREADGFDWLRLSASKGLFSPAMVDMARFVIGGVGVDAPDTSVGLRMLWDAHKFGHRMALVYTAKVLIAGGRGLIGRLLGGLLLPVAVLRAAIYARRSPLHQQVFVTSAITPRPLFKLPAVNGPEV